MHKNRLSILMWKLCNNFTFANEKDDFLNSFTTLLCSKHTENDKTLESTISSK